MIMILNIYKNTDTHIQDESFERNKECMRVIWNKTVLKISDEYIFKERKKIFWLVKSTRHWSFIQKKMKVWFSQI